MKYLNLQPFVIYSIISSMKKKISPIILLIGLTFYAFVISLLSSQSFKAKAYEDLQLEQVYPRVEKNESPNTESSQGEVKGVADGVGSNVCKSSNCGCEECILDAKEGNYYPLASDSTVTVKFKGYGTQPNYGETKEISIGLEKVTWPNQVYAGIPENALRKVNPTYPITSEKRGDQSILKINSPEVGEGLTKMFPNFFPPEYTEEGGEYYNLLNTVEGSCQTTNENGKYNTADNGPFALQYKINFPGGTGLNLKQSRDLGTITLYDSLGTSANPDKLNKMANKLNKIINPPREENSISSKRDSGEYVFQPEVPHDEAPGNSKVIYIDAVDNYIGCVNECSTIVGDTDTDGNKYPEYFITGTAKLTKDYNCNKTQINRRLGWECSKEFPLTLELGSLVGSNYGGDGGFNADSFYDNILSKHFTPEGIPEHLKATDIPDAYSDEAYIRDVYIAVPCDLRGKGVDTGGVHCVYQASFVQAHLYLWLINNAPTDKVLDSEGYLHDNIEEAFWGDIQKTWNAWGEVCVE